MQTITVRLKKISEVENPVHPDNIEVGFDRTFKIAETFFEEPKMGEAFYPSAYWRTSTVQEIIDKNTFRTKNSVYHWEIIHNSKQAHEHESGSDQGSRPQP